MHHEGSGIWRIWSQVNGILLLDAKKFGIATTARFTVVEDSFFLPAMLFAAAGLQAGRNREFSLRSQRLYFGEVGL